tara:strand:- start:508 stop:627 length:120 start_codon:yes stop_codon:yes gene_type:complete
MKGANNDLEITINPSTTTERLRPTEEEGKKVRFEGDSSK